MDTKNQYVEKKFIVCFNKDKTKVHMTDVRVLEEEGLIGASMSRNNIGCL